MLFSERSGILKSQPQLDFVDIDLSADFPLYFDPATFLDGNDEFAKACASDIYDFFDAVMEAIRNKDRQRGILLLSALREPNDTFLGVSRGKPAGRGLGPEQAAKIYRNLERSKAIQTSLITDLSDYAMFIDGIGPDKISDMTTNIIRGNLLKYTTDQCNLLGIELENSLPSGLIWDSNSRIWSQKYVNRPYFDDMTILLVPKRYVKWKGAVNKRTKSYYKHFVRNFIKDEQLSTNGSLVTVVKTKNGTKRDVYYKDIERKFPNTKQFLADFSEKNPKEYAKFKKVVSLHNPVADKAIFKERDDEYFDDEFALHLADTLRKIPAGKANAYRYHQFMVGVIQFIFYPHLTAPSPEAPINDSKKFIDITYVNAAETGFFARIRDDTEIRARLIMIECKNYFDDPSNPEIDQIAMRFDPRRGRFGILLFRSASNRPRLDDRCRDISKSDGKYILGFDDSDLIALLDLISSRRRSGIEAFVQTRFNSLIS